jgi:Tol biopolymer transport system component
MNPDGTHRRRLARGSRPQWSPDGRWIAYEGGERVYVTKVDGSGKKPLARGGGRRWSPDGKQIAFTGRSNDVYLVNTRGGGQRRVVLSAPTRTVDSMAQS